MKYLRTVSVPVSTEMYDLVEDLRSDPQYGGSVAAFGRRAFQMLLEAHAADLNGYQATLLATIKELEHQATYEGYAVMVHETLDRKAAYLSMLTTMGDWAGIAADLSAWCAVLEGRPERHRRLVYAAWDKHAGIQELVHIWREHPEMAASLAKMAPPLSTIQMSDG